jgi:hypothetical protein
VTGIARAKWIWTADDPVALHVWVRACRRFEVQQPAGAFLDITADLRYFVWINGQPVGFGPPKFHAATPTVDRYPIESFLTPGTNTITVLVYSYGGDGKLSSVMPQRGALRACLACDGREIVTDRTWEVCRERAYAADTVRRGECQPPVEVFDARQALSEPWQPATELPELKPTPTFELRDIPLFGWETHAPDRCIATGLATFERGDITKLAAAIAHAPRRPDYQGRVRIEAPVALDATGLPAGEGCYALWDFGRIWTGYPVIELSGTPGTVVDLSYAEHLRKGTIDPTKNGLHYFDRIILGDGKLTHRITWPKCCRYLQVDVHGGRGVIESLALQRSTYPVQWVGCFHCSDPALDQAWEISAHTVQLCMEDSYMDTPWRERGSWLGDDLPKALANYAVFGDAVLMRRFLLQHARGQLPSGAMQGKYPGCKSSHISTWTLMYPVSLREYVRHTGDHALAAELWPVVERILRWLESYRLPEGVYGNLPLTVTAETNIYNFIDWAPVDTSGANAAWNAHAYNCLRAAAFVARIAGDHVAAHACDERAAALREQFQRLFWDAARGVFVNGWHNGKQLRRWGCHENYLAVLFDIATDGQRASILQRLQQEDLTAVFVPDRKDYDTVIPETDANWTVAIALNKYRWDDTRMVSLGTPYFAGFALEAMCKLGLTREALDFIRLHWGEFSRQGATTVWETWNRESGSNSHGWGCAPAFLLAKYILGVAPSDDPSCDYVIFPQRGDLTWARGRVATPKGAIDVSWEFNGLWHMEVNLPPSCVARVGLPLRSGEQLWCDSQVIRQPTELARGNSRYQVVLLSGGSHVVHTG